MSICLWNIGNYAHYGKLVVLSHDTLRPMVRESGGDDDVMQLVTATK